MEGSTVGDGPCPSVDDGVGTTLQQGAPVDAQIELRRPVVVKVIMTAPFRQQLVAEARDTIARIQRNLDIINGQSEPLTAEQQGMLEQFEAMKVQLEWRIRELEGVEDGAELPFRAFDTSVTLRRGDNFLEKMGQSEIVLRDWEVVEIRGQ